MPAPPTLSLLEAWRAGVRGWRNGKGFSTLLLLVLLFLPLLFYTFLAGSENTLSACMEDHSFRGGADIGCTLLFILFLPLSSFLYLLLYLWFSLAFLRVALKLSTGETPGLNELWHPFPLFAHFLLGFFFYGAGGVAVGFIILAMSFFPEGGILGELLRLLLILLFLGGWIYLALRFSLFGYLLVDQGVRIGTALKESYRLARGATLPLFLFYLSLSAANLLGILLLIGWIVTVPVGFIAWASLYRQLSIRSV